MNINLPVDFEPQYHALRGGSGVAALVGWSSITVSGADRQKFLHNFCTNDVMRLTPGQACEAFFLNVKGKIIGHGLIICRPDELVILGSSGQAAQLIEHLDRYIIREDVQLRDSTEEHSFLVTGSAANLPAESFVWNVIGSDASHVFEVAAAELPSLSRSLAERGLLLVGPLPFEAARIEAGFPLFGFDFNADNLPQEVGRDRQAISFHKGCYLGQETVARIDALGHVNRRIVGVRFFGTDIPLPGTELKLAGSSVGAVSSAMYSPTLSAPLALAMLRREATAAGTRLQSAAGECEVIDLPLRPI
jgi:folate-binding protein YgfZ